MNTILNTAILYGSYSGDTPPPYIGLVVGSVFAVVAALYLLPTIIATCRRHPNRVPITIMNVPLALLGFIWMGFILLGYIVILAWSCTATSRDVHHYHHKEGD